MVDITHDMAVAILKSVDTTAVIRVEKNAINISDEIISTSEEDEDEVDTVEVCAECSVIMHTCTHINTPPPSP